MLVFPLFVYQGHPFICVRLKFNDLYLSLKLQALQVYRGLQSLLVKTLSLSIKANSTHFLALSFHFPKLLFLEYYLDQSAVIFLIAILHCHVWFFRIRPALKVVHEWFYVIFLLTMISKHYQEISYPKSKEWLLMLLNGACQNLIRSN